MTTSKPFATISYNSEPFLKSKLDSLVDTDFIDFYAFIKHRKEDDEKKDHIHLYIVPSSKINTKTVLSVLEEKLPDFEKPLGCMPACSSRFADWYMYCLHDKAYLSSKGQSREHCYNRDEFVCSDEDFLDDCIHRIDRSKWVGNERLVNAVKDNKSFESLVRSGQIPVQLIHQYKFMYDVLSFHGVYRNGRETHSPGTSDSKPFLYNEETGEVLSDSVNDVDLSPFDNPFFDPQQQGLIDED